MLGRGDEAVNRLPRQRARVKGIRLFKARKLQ